jgi:excinuclease ABC subunit A
MSRLAESVETALVEGEGDVLIQPVMGSKRSDQGAGSKRGEELRLSQRRYCTLCGVTFPELSPQSFSFNSPLGMCPECNGLGTTLEMDPKLVVPDESLSIRQGAVKPLAGVMERSSGINYSVFVSLEKELGLDLDRPWGQLAEQHRELVLYGMGDRTIDVEWQGRQGARRMEMGFEGIMNTLMRRYRETKSEGMRRYYQTFFAHHACRSCGGARLRPESRAVEVGGATIVEIARMAVEDARAHFASLKLAGADALVAEELLKEISSRFDFLCSVGLGYLTLERSGPSLSGGEAQRIRLASQLGSELSGVMYVLDEPSIGLHPRDNARLIRTLRRLRDTGNTVIVVEHDRETIESADHVVDFGPGAGELGGRVVFAGTPAGLRRRRVLTGQYLAGKMRIEVPERRRAVGSARIRIIGAAENNLNGIDVDFPLETMIAVTGVSGAGKSSLVTSTLYPALQRSLHASTRPVGAHVAIEGAGEVDKVIHIDQSPIGRTPRSNPATYTKVFDHIRAILAEVPEARARGYKRGRFSFNVAGGRCEACAGDGVKRVEMHFLPDVYVPCEVCRGKRYNEATLEIRYRGLNVFDILKLSVSRALEVFGAYPKVKRILQTLADVGLDYVELGQPAPTLSGGEAQRVKLSRELAKRSTGSTFYVLDEPTTGLHFDDIRKLLEVLHRLVDGGNTVVIIEHNPDVIKSVDHVIDLGPEGGQAGGDLVCAGTPEQVAQHPGSHTGRVLAEVLGL